MINKLGIKYLLLTLGIAVFGGGYAGVKTLKIENFPMESRILGKAGTKTQNIENQVLGTSTTAEPSVLAATKSTEDFQFSINVPARFMSGSTFSGTANFLSDLVAPNILYSLKTGEGISSTGGQNPTITNTGVLSLNSRTGKLNLTAGDGINIDGLTIKNTGILSLTAGDNISIDGNKISNTYSAPAVDYTQSGWTKTGTSVGLTTHTDSVLVDALTAGNITMTNGTKLLPDTDLGSDLGSSTKRFNNLWVGTINSNSSQGFSGQTTFSYPPTDATITQSSVLINPTTSFASGQLLGLGIAGYQRAIIDAEGDITLGYNSLTSAPTSDYPLNIYGHSGTRVSFTDTSGNAYFAGNVGIGTTAPVYALDIGSGNVGTTGEITGNRINSTQSSTSGYVFYGKRTNTNPIFTVYSDGSGVSNLGLYLDGLQKIKLNSSGDTYFNGGNVGIGTTSPSNRLHIVSASTSTAGLVVSGGSSLDSSAMSGQILIGATDASTVTSSISMGRNTYDLMIDNRFDNDSGDIYFRTRTNGTPRNALVITGAGNIGIGTTAPNQEFEVVGQMRLSGAGASQIEFYGSGQYAGLYNYSSNNQLTLSSRMTDGYTYSAISLQNDLPIVGTTGTQIFTKIIPTFAPTSGTAKFVGLNINPIINQTGTATGDYTGLQINVTETAATGTNKFLADFQAGGLSKMVITSGGNVGIGTTAPGANFEVRGTSPNAKLTGSAGSLTTTVASAGIQFDSGATWYPYYFLNGSVGINYTDLTGTTGKLLVNGNVGIGTTAPGNKLEIDGGASDGTLRVYGAGRRYNTLINNNSLFLQDSSNTSGYIYTGGSSPLTITPSGYLALKTNGNEAMRIDTSGNVGIGTTNPQDKLQIESAGGATFRIQRNDSVTAAGRIDFTGSDGVIDARMGYNVNVYEGLEFTTGGTGASNVRLLITSAGNVGIGTTAPGYKLDVNGKGRFGLVSGFNTSIGESGIEFGYQATQANYGSIQFTGGGADITSAGNPIRLNNGSAVRMTILSTGNVGVGTTAPANLFDVGKSTAGAISSITATHGASGENMIGELRFRSTGVSAGGSDIASMGMVINTTNTVNIGALTFNIKAAASGSTLTEAMRITYDGKVGIGTTNPTYSLHVVGNSIFTTGVNFASASEYLKYDAGLTSSVLNSYYPLILSTSAGSNNPITFRTNNSEIVRITSTGYVGIGTTSPTFGLQVNGNDLRIEKSSGATLVFGRTGFTSYDTKIVNGDVSGSDMSFYKGTTRIFRLTNEGAFAFGSTYSAFSPTANNMIIEGSVGIGTTAPGYKLDVKASGTGIIARFNNDNNSGCTVADGGTISCSSDRTLKKNIDTINYGLTEVMKLNPVAFNWNFDGNDKAKSLGFIAQDVEEIMPGLVSIDPNGLRSLNTIGLVPVLAKAIQEQQLKIDEMALSTGSARITSSSWNNLKNFVEDINTHLTAFIKQITDKFRTKELCLGEEGNETCIKKEQLDELIKLLPQPTATQSGGQATPSPTVEVTPTPTPTLEASESGEATSSANL